MSYGKLCRAPPLRGSRREPATFRVTDQRLRPLGQKSWTFWMSVNLLVCLRAGGRPEGHMASYRRVITPQLFLEYEESLLEVFFFGKIRSGGVMILVKWK